MIFKGIIQGEWHTWFAWFQIITQQGDLIWLEHVQRWHSKSATYPFQYKKLIE